MMRKIGLLGWCVVIVSLAFWWALNPHSEKRNQPASTPPPTPRSGVGMPSLHPIPADQLPAQPRSPLADALHASAQPATQDLQIVLRLLQRYRETFRGFPAGEDNRQIVNALTGNNPQGLAILPPKHPAVSGSGELLDRWGTPFFFHLVDRDRVEITSFGPDRERGTPDDLQLASSPATVTR